MAKKIIYIILFIFITNLFGGKRENLRVIFLDIGQGNCQIIKTPSGKVIVIDSGTDKYTDKIIQKLEELGIKKNGRIEAIVISNPQSYNIGGFTQILDNYDIGNIYDPGIHFTSFYYESLLEKIMNIQDRLSEAKGIESEKRISDILSSKNHFEYFNPKAGDILNWDPDLEVFVLSPKRLYHNTRSDVNNNSLVIKMVYNKVSFIFTGDIEQQAERDLILQGAKLRSTVIKVPNFGSSYSSTIQFLRLVSPEIAIISVGKDNPYGYPSPDVLQSYKELSSKIYRTDLNGTIEVITDGISLQVIPEIKTSEAEIFAQVYEKKEEAEETEKYTLKPKININSASAEELLNLPNLGVVKAQMIVKYRNTNGKFNSIEDLLKVPGINKVILEQIKEFITLN